MTGVDAVAVLSAGVASVCLGLRAYMLKPTFGSWCTAPGLVWGSLLVLSVACAISALSILRGGGHATAREALVLLSLAVSSAILLRNLHKQTPPNVNREEVA